MTPADLATYATYGIALGVAALATVLILIIRDEARRG